ncbi:MAG: CoA transferase [Streptosporangiaceae bacterium]|jgi:hypothetical protein
MKHTGPLSEVRVVDLTAMVMGPYCTQIMADMGADVIKIEPPAGDNTRHISVGPEPGMAGVFVNVNRGKRSVLLDLRSGEAKAVLRGLIKQGDVFIHSMRAKAIAKLGFSYAEVAAINPSIVYTNCYGYGRRGPNADLTAYDDTIQAECGLPFAQERLTGEASYVGTIMADKIAGLTALYATMMALFHRERTGEGQEVEVGMFETMASFMLVEHANGAMFSPPLGSAVYPARWHPTGSLIAPKMATYPHWCTTTSSGPHLSAPYSRPGPPSTSPPLSNEHATLIPSIRCWAKPSWRARRRTGLTCSGPLTFPLHRSARSTSYSTIRIWARQDSSRRWIPRTAPCGFPAYRPGSRKLPAVSPARPPGSAPIHRK